MGFFNKKEDVIQIELTPHGNKLLSTGQFKPEYYAFFDDDVIYDASWAGNAEVQNDVHTRITTDTPRVKVQPTIESVDITRMSVAWNPSAPHQLGKDLGLPKVDAQGMLNKYHSLASALGTSGDIYDFAPAWKVNLLKGSISGSTTYISGYHSPARIPQIQLNPIIYRSKVTEEGAQTSVDPCDGHEYTMTDGSISFPDGTVILTEEDSVILDVEELNTFFENENFEIEVFKEQVVSPTKRFLTSLSFEKQEKEINEHGLLVDREDNLGVITKIDQTYVSHFFDILVDDEIPESLLSELLPDGQVNGGLFSKKFYRKQKLDQRAGIEDVYSGDFDDDVELCDDDS